MGSITVPQLPTIPKTCVGAVVKDEGPNFYVEIEELPVPEISAFASQSLGSPFH